MRKATPGVSTCRMIATLGALALTQGCGCEPRGASDPGRFDRMEKVDLTIGAHTVRSWVAKTDNDREAGFMYVEAKQLERLPDGADPGMLFVFRVERSRDWGFWMKNVPVPLDIAFLDRDGRIVTIRTMAPYDTRTSHSEGSYRFALEVRGGLFKSLGVREGDVVVIPESVLNNVE